METVKTCKIHGETTFGYHADKKLGGRWRCRKCQTAYTRSNLDRVRKRAAEIKLENGCTRCGYKKCAQALHFAHRDASTKIYNVSQIRSLTKFLNEVSKCDVMCANCHIESHAMQDTLTVGDETLNLVV